MKSLKWKGFGTKYLFPHISNVKDRSYHSFHLIWSHLNYIISSQLSGSESTMKRPGSPWLRPVRTK